MNLEQLKSELKEKEKGCGKTYEWKKGFFIKCGDYKEKRYQCSTCQAEISALKKGIEAVEQRDKEILEKIEKYDKYPSDVFPFMDKLQLRKIDVFMKETFGFPLDRLSAHLMRLSQENIKEELKQQLTTKEGGKE